MCRLAKSVKNRRQQKNQRENLIVSRPACMEIVTSQKHVAVNFFIHLGECYLFFLLFSLDILFILPTLFFNDK